MKLTAHPTDLIVCGTFKFDYIDESQQAGEQAMTDGSQPSKAARSVLITAGTIIKVLNITRTIPQKVTFGVMTVDENGQPSAQQLTAPLEFVRRITAHVLIPAGAQIEKATH